MKTRYWLLLVSVLVYATVFWTTLRSTSQNTDPSSLRRRHRPNVIYRRDWKEGSEPTTFLLGIFTVMEDVHRRRLIRETMLGKSLPDDAQERLCSLQQQNTSRIAKKNCRLVYAFVVGGNPQADEEWSPESTIPMTLDPTRMLKHETDILYLNIRENMNEGKTPTWFRYASSLHFDYVAKADADTLVSVPALLNFLERRLPPKSERPVVYGGHLNEFDECGGGGSVCDKVRGKVYMSGQFYWLSLELARYYASSCSNRRFLRTGNEDTDLGFVVLSYPEPIELSVCNGATFWIHGLKDQEAWNQAFREKMMDQWQDTNSNWRNGLYEPETDQNRIVRSFLGRVESLEKMPILLD